MLHVAASVGIPTCDPSTWKTEAGGQLRAQSQPVLQSEFKTGLNYTAKNKNKQKTTPHTQKVTDDFLNKVSFIKLCSL